MCIGYSVLQAPGLWRVYDANGSFVALEEAPLESPLIDPTDIALLAYGAFRLLFSGSRALLQSGTKSLAGVKLSQSTTSLLRGQLKMGLSARHLKMTETAAKHMYNPGRYVPLQIQEKAIRYGRRMPDPKKRPGMYCYETEINKIWFNKHLKKQEYKKYTLEVVVREKDWTIAHFICF